MDALDSVSFDNNGSSTVNLGSDLGPLGDAASPFAQASWDQAAADAGLGGGGTDSWGNPISGALDVTDPAGASAPSQDSIASQSTEQPAQDDASGALPAALAGTMGAATMDGASAGGSGLLAELGLGGLARTAAGLLGSGLAAPVAGALALFWPSSTASNDTAPSGGWPTQPQAAPGGSIVESNPGNSDPTPPSGSATSSGQTGSAAADGSPPAGDTQGANTTPKAAGSTQAMPPLPANPDDLLAQGWEETSHPKAAATGRRTFVKPETGQSIEFDKGRPGEAGWRGQDHYHVLNPHSTGKRDLYLDKAGQSAPDGSKASHIPPGK